MKKILVTRPIDVAKKMAEHLRSEGFECVLDPMLIPVRAENVTFMDRGAEDGFIFSSPRGVRYFVEAASNLNLDLPVWCVGDKTAEMARQNGFTNIHAGEGDSFDLADLIVAESKTPAKLLHPCGADVQNRFYKTLKTADIEVVPLQVYTMETAPRMQEDALVKIRTDDVYAVLFFSTRTAEALLKLAAQQHISSHTKNMIAVCIRQNVANALEAKDWSAIAVSQEKTEDSMIETLKQLKEG